VGWYGRWLLDHRHELNSVAPAWFLDTALPQALAMVCCPLVPQWDWEDELIEVIDTLAPKDDPDV
jgi:hypothetical protein